MTSPRIDWAKRENHPLMRKPEHCGVCHRVHLPTEPCLTQAHCIHCGTPVGLVERGEEGHVECRRCLREEL